VAIYVALLEKLKETIVGLWWRRIGLNPLLTRRDAVLAQVLKHAEIGSAASQVFIHKITGKYRC
jgi:hypothetical protein